MPDDYSSHNSQTSLAKARAARWAFSESPTNVSSSSSLPSSSASGSFSLPAPSDISSSGSRKRLRSTVSSSPDDSVEARPSKNSRRDRIRTEKNTYNERWRGQRAQAKAYQATEQLVDSLATAEETAAEFADEVAQLQDDLVQVTQSKDDQIRELHEQLRLTQEALSQASRERDASAQDVDDLRRSLAQQLAKSEAHHHCQLEAIRAELSRARDSIAKAEIYATELDFQRRAALEKAGREAARASRFARQVDMYKHREARAAKAEYVSVLPLMEDGMVPMNVRLGIIELVTAGVSFGRVYVVMALCAKLMRVEVRGTFSRRTVQRVLAESLVAAKLQIIYELSLSRTFTLSSDGTDVRRVTTSSKQLHLPQKPVYGPSGVQLVDEPVTRTLPVSTLENHTSKRQFDDWEGTFRDFYDTYTRCYGRPVTVQDWRDLVDKFSGFMADHAADQLLLFQLFVNWKEMIVTQALGDSELAAMSEAEVLERMAQHMLSREEEAKPWSEMTVDEQAELKAKAWVELCVSTGKEAFAQLSAEERRRFTLLFRGGCWAHKVHNAYKHGCLGVHTLWTELGLSGPVPLVNKVAAASMKGMTSEQAEQILNKAQSGGIHVAQTAGMLYNHWDEKKGLQHAHRWYFQQMATNAQKAFAKTSSNRYASHGVASTELICRRDLYIEFLDHHVRLSKQKATLNNMEANLVKGLQCLYTVTELCTYALYSQVLELPVMKLIRRRYGPDGKVQNHLTMGWLVEKITAYSGLIIADPELLLARDSNTADGLPSTIDGSPWLEPELFDAIQSLLSELPYLRQAIGRMFEWALDKWVTFCAEYNEGDTIDSLADEEIEGIWMPNTNDGNESNNGLIRIAYRQNPNMSELMLNARNMAKMNGTVEFMRYILGLVESRFLREEARRLLGSGLGKLRKDRVVESKKEAAKNRREKEIKRAARLDELRRKEAELWKLFVLEEIEDDPIVLKTKRTEKLPSKDWLELQLLWHRKRALDRQEQFPTKTSLKNNTLRAEHLSCCIKAFKAEKAAGVTLDLPQPVSERLEGFEDMLDDAEDAELDDEYDDEDAEMDLDEEMDDELEYD